MGLHFVNLKRLDDVNKNGVFDAAHPQIVIYEPTSDGSLRLLGADYLVFADAWNGKHPNGPRNSWSSVSIYSKVRIALVSRRSTRSTSGRGRIIPMAPS